MADVGAQIKEFFAQLSTRINMDVAKGMNSTIQFNLTGDGGGTYHIVVKDGAVTVNDGAAASPNMTMTVSATDYLDIQSGKLNGQMAFMSGKMKIAGDMGLAMKMQTLIKPAPAAPAAAAPAAAAAAPAAPAASGVGQQIKDFFTKLPSLINADAAKGMNSTIQFNLTGDGAATYHIVVKDGAATVAEGPAATPNMTMTVSAQDYLDIQSGKLNGQMAFMSGKMKIAGDMGLAMKMQSLIKKA